MLQRSLYSEEHEIFRQSVRRFMEEEIAPRHEGWEDQGYVDRDAWEKAGDLGFLCATMPEAYGGADADRRYSAILMEEQARIGATGPGFSLHSDIVAPYINRYGSEDQKREWLPKMASGEAIGAIAMTEPGTGSDLQGVKTSAVKDGNELVINGSKTFITNGWNADVVVVVTKTDPSAGAKGTSLVLVEAGREGFTKGKRLKKLGMKAQDTSELFFDNVRVPMTNMLGEEGQGFIYLMQELAWERLQVAITAVTAAEAAIEQTVTYTKERKAFGKSIADFQNTRFKLAELTTQTQIGRVFVDKCIELVCEGKLDAETGAMAKYWCSDLQCKVIDECLQLHGGYGYMWEYPIARAYADARVQRIYAGTNEIMKEIIGRSL
ncbi:MAG: acyl-CoA dehydrogenase family protein [Minwuiales bacterium]|nr:acyl-CoA dehydrogenase family protein [Minwuiales bacterium]